ncbi:MAG: phosphatidate cytidylyltransferase, partial [Ferruginibacter sp.]
MPLDKKTFSTRAITAVVFAGVMLLGLFTGLWPFLILCSIIMVGAVVEFVKLINKIHPHQPAAYYLLAIVYIVLPIFL